MPHLLVPRPARRAGHDTSARRLLTLNLEHSGETAGFSCARQVEALADHAPRLRLDVVLADPVAWTTSTSSGPRPGASARRWSSRPWHSAGHRGTMTRCGSRRRTVTSSGEATSVR